MRKQLLLGALTAFGLTFATQLSAQQQGNFRCGTAEALKKRYAEDPQLEADFYNLLAQNKEMRTEKGKTRAVYVIPVVFHVLHQYGQENIPDANIYDQMRILNEDFRAQNDDISDVVPAFQDVVADAQIEFRLASKDPQGNCTNGIDHIYTHNTDLADDFSKHNQWHRSRYLNVWVVNTIGDAGVAGYAYYPTATINSSFWIDGIIILKNYIGSLSPSNPGSSRALTHEIGHYLSLPHTWGSTNDPEVACGDDGIDDTPITKGHDNCQVLNDIDCTPGVIENVQNFMEYSYCSNMYTVDQVEVMKMTLDSDISGRNNLRSVDNLALTGADYNTDPLERTPCIPQADFNPSSFMACTGANITFTNFTWRSAATSYSWSFPGATPSTSTAQNPTVSYAQPGWYNVTLTATNAAGSNTVTKNNVVYVGPTWPEYTGPFSTNFNNDNGFFISQDLGNSYSQWQRVAGVGKSGAGCYKLQNFRNIDNAAPYSDESYYYARLAGAKDNLITPGYDLSTTSSVTVSFDFAYGSRTATLADITEKINIWSSRDCGQTWTLRKTIQGAEILTAGYVGSTDFSPTTDSQWKNYSFAYAANSLDKRTRFKIEYVASDYSSNVYIDNFNISGVLGVSDLDNEISPLSLSPNPVAQGADLAIEIGAMTEDMTIQVVNMEGKLISTHYVSPVNGTQTIHIPMNVSKGCYMINASQGSARSTNRVIVF